MSLINCPDCGKIVSTEFVIHHCKPKKGHRNDLQRLMAQPDSFFKTHKSYPKHNRFTTSVQITSNKPLTQKQWQNIHQAFADAIENTIMESEKMTDQIGHVHLGSPWDNGLEICI